MIIALSLGYNCILVAPIFIFSFAFPNANALIDFFPYCNRLFRARCCHFCRKFFSALFFFFFIYYFFPLESALTHPLRYYEWADVLFRAYMLHADRILNNDDARNATKCSESKSHHVLLGGRALNAFRRVVFRRYLDQRDDSYSRR